VRTGCPGFAASSRSVSGFQKRSQGTLTTQQLRDEMARSSILPSSIGNWLRQMRHSFGRADGLKRSFLRHAVTRQAGNHVQMRSGWLARAAFVFGVGSLSNELLEGKSFAARILADQIQNQFPL
jgi:hypothetical protein